MDEFERQFQELRRAYHGTLAERLRELDEALGAAEAGDMDALTAAYRLAHRVCGTTGTYGFGAISAATGAIEQALQPVIEGERAASDVDWAAVQGSWQAASDQLGAEAQ